VGTGTKYSTVSSSSAHQSVVTRKQPTDAVFEWIEESWVSEGDED